MDSMSLKDKELIIKLLYKNDGAITVTPRKFCTAKGLKKKKGPISLSGILKFVKHFKETNRLAGRTRNGRLSLIEARVAAVCTNCNGGYGSRIIHERQQRLLNWEGFGSA